VKHDEVIEAGDQKIISRQEAWCKAPNTDIAFEIGKRYRQGIEAWIAVGETLAAEKEQMPPGEWTRWLHDNRKVLGFGERTAQRFMALAEDPTLTSETLWGNKRRISKSGKGDADPKNSGSCVINDDHPDNNSVASEESAERKAQFLANATAALQAAHYDGPADDDIVAAARWVADAWAKLAHDMEARHGKSIPPFMRRASEAA
jgi:hypothetical protein